jgi:hypothetical protein
VFLPWIGLSERKELTRRFQSLVGEPIKETGKSADVHLATTGAYTVLP